MAIERGLVIGLRRGAAGIIWSISASHILVIPIGGYNGPPPHRAEVRITDVGEIFACGVALTFPVARCHQIYQLDVAVANTAPVLGKVPVGLMGRIQSSVIREARAQVTERQVFSDEARNPVFLAAS